MSTTIDEKIVSMQFDNRHFESNVNTTMSTLDKLKQKLRFSDSAKGFEDINSAAKKCDLSPLAKSAETVSAKFSAMQVMGVTALANLTNSAVNAGKKIISALTIDPVKTGLSEYETKMNAIQVLQANTRGKNTMDDINKALEELNAYADKTIYNFAQMTSNAGKFAAQGMDVFQATNAIKGLANLAAASGASAEDMSRATYQMSQSMGGYIKLIDWNSLRNANMATQDLKNTLIDLAKVNDIKIDEMIKKHGTFEQTLSEGWLSGEMFTKAMNIYSGIYSDAELAAMGFNEAQIKNFKELAAMAESAATEVKTFTQLFDVLKETAQSGWTQTWEIIIGDFETAKKNLTKLQIYFSGLIDKMSDARNLLLGGAFNPKKTWANLSDKIINSLGLSKLQKVVDTVDKLKHSLEDYRSVVWKVWDGEFGNADTMFGDASSGRYKLLEDAGYDHRVVQSLVDKGYYYKPTDEEIEAALERYGVTLDNAEANDELAVSLDNLRDEQLKSAGLTRAEINLYKDLAEEAKRSGKSIDELVEEMSNLDGRERMINALKNAWSGISGIFSAGSTAWAEIFEPFTAVDLYKIITSIEKFSEALRIEKESETFKDLVRIFKGVFAILDIITTLAGGAFKIVFKVVSQLLGAFNMTVLDFLALIGDAAVNVRDFIDGILDFSIIIEHVTEGVKQLIESWGTWIQNCMDAYAKDGVVGLARAIADGFVNAFKNVGKWFGELFSNIGEGASNLPGLISDSILGKIWDVLKIVGGTMVELGKIIIRSICAGLGMEDSVAENIINGIGDIVSSIKTWFADLPGNVIAGLEQIPGFINSGFMQGMWEGVKNIGAVVIEFAKTIIDNICSVLGIHSPSTVMIAIGGFIIAGLIGGLTSGSSSVFDWIKNFGSNIISAFQNIDFGKIVAIFTSVAMALTATKFGKVLDGFGDLLGGVGDLLGGVGEVLAKSARAIRKVIKTSAKVVKSFSKVLNGFAKIEKATAFSIRMNAIAVLIKSLVMLAAALFVLTLVDTKKLLVAAGVMVALIAALTIMVKVLDNNSLDPRRSAESFKNILSFSSVISSLSLALIALAITAKIIGGMETEALIKAGFALAAVVGAIVILMAATKYLARNSMGDAIGGIDKVGKMLTSFAGAMLIIAIAARIIGGMDTKALIKAGLVLAAVTGAAVVLMSATKRIARNNVGDIVGLSQFGKILTSLATSLLIVAVAAKLFEGISWGGIIKAGLALFALASVVISLMTATNMLAKTTTGRSAVNLMNLGKMLTSIALAMLVMGVAAKVFESISWSGLIKSGVAILALTGVIVVLMAATKMLGSDFAIARIGPALMKIGAAMLIMSFAAKIMAKMSKEDLEKAIVGISALGGVIAVLMAATRYASSGELKRVASTILAASLAIGVLAAISVLLGFIDADALTKGITAVSVLSIMMAMLIKSTRGAQNCKDEVVAMAIAIGVMAAAVIALSFIDGDKLITAGAALGSLMLAMAAMIAATGQLVKSDKKVGRAIGVLYSLIGVVVALAVIIGVMSAFSYNSSVIENATAISIILAALSGAISVIGKIKTLDKTRVKNVAKMLLALSGVVLALAVIIGIMSRFSYSSSVIENATAISIILAALSGAISVIGKIKTLDKTRVKNVAKMLLALSGVVLALATIIGVMSAFSYSSSVIENATAISILLLAMSVVVAALSTIKVVNVKAIVPAIVALGAVIVAMYGIVGVLAIMDGINVSLKNVVALSALIVVAASILPILAICGLFGVAAVAGAASLLLVAAGVLAFVGILYLMEGLTKADKNLELIESLIKTMADVLVSIAKTGPFALVAVAAIAGLEVAMVALGALAVAVGALVDTFPWLEKFLYAGVPLLEKLANAIGSIVGNLVNGFFNAATQNLPEIGSRLGEFMINAKPFIEGSKNVTLEVLEGLGILTGAILALSVANVINAITTLLSFGSSFADLGTELSKFVMNAMPFIKTMMTINPKALDGAKTLADAILTLVGSNVLDQLTSFITGGTDLAAFGTSAAQFGEGLKSFSDSIKDMDDSTLSRTKIAAEAAKYLAEMADSLPKQGGIWQNIVGTSDMADFGNKLASFGGSLVAFSGSVNGLTDADISKIETAAAAGKELAGIEDAIPKKGGVWQDIAGEEDIAKFGLRLVAFGQSLVAYAKTIKTISDDDITKINTATSAGKALAELEGVLPKQDGWWQEIAGSSDIGVFGSKLSTFGEGIVSYVEAVRGINDSDISAIESSKNALIAIKEVASEVPTSGAIWEFFVGSSDSGDFGAGVKTLSEAITSYIKTSNGVSKSDIDSIKKSKDAVIALKDIAKEASGVGFSFGLANVSASIDDIRQALMNLSVVDSSAISSLMSSNNGVIPALKNTAKELGEIDITNLYNAIKTIDNISYAFEKLCGIKFDDLSKIVFTKPSFSSNDIQEFINIFTGVKTDIWSLVGETGKVAALNSLIEVVKKLDFAGLSNKTFELPADITTQKISDFIKIFADIDTDMWELIGETGKVGALKAFIDVIKDIDFAGVSNINFTNPSTLLTGSINSLIEIFEGIDAPKMDTAKPIVDKLKEFIDGIKAINFVGIEDTTLKAPNSFNAVTINKLIHIFTGTGDNAINILELEKAKIVVGLLKDFVTTVKSIDFTGLDDIKLKVPKTFNAVTINKLIKVFTGGTEDVENSVNIEELEKAKTVVGLLNDFVTVIKGLDFADLENLEIKQPKNFNAVAINKLVNQFIGADDYAVNTGDIELAQQIAESLNSFITSVKDIDFSGIEDISLKQPKNLNKVAIEKFLKIFSEVDTSLFEKAESNIKSIVDIIGEAEGITSESIANLNSLPEISAASINAFVQAFSDAAPTVNTTGSEFINGLIAGMNSSAESVIEAAKKLVADACSGIYVYYNSFFMAGVYCWQGLKAGLLNGKYQIYLAGRELGKDAKDGFEDETDENSPSKEFYKDAMFCVAGIVNGFAAGGSAVYAAGASAGESVMDGFSEAISKVTDVINSDLDVQPTIRPVLDLSNVQSGAGKINSMLNMDASVGAYATAGAINATMSNRQNRSTGDVISAIKDLGKNLGKSSGDTYQVNGVTYDDGSNVSDAVGALVRAIKVERRK